MSERELPIIDVSGVVEGEVQARPAIPPWRLLRRADRAFGDWLTKHGHRIRTPDEIKAAEETGIAQIDHTVGKVTNLLKRRPLPPPPAR